MFAWNFLDVINVASSVNVRVDLLGPAIVAVAWNNQSLPISVKEIGLRFLSRLQFIQDCPRKHESCIHLHLGWIFSLFQQNIWMGVRTLKKKQRRRRRRARGCVKRKRFDAVESMDTIHCQDPLDSPHTNSWESQDFHPQTEVKRRQSNSLSCTWKLVASFGSPQHYRALLCNLSCSSCR